jgi:hypothetical protein
MRRLAATTLAIACAASACVAGDDATSRADAGVGVHASLQRSTLFETQRAFRLTVSHDGDDDIRVGTIQLDSPWFDQLAPQERDARVRAGGRVDMPLQFGTSVCDAGDEQADVTSSVLATVDGEEVRLALDESAHDVLAALNANECAAAAVLDDVELSLGDTWENTGERTVAGRLVASRRSPDTTVVVDDVLGNVIFSADTTTTGTDTDSDTAHSAGTGAPAVPWLAVNDEQTSATGEVTITAARCDPHALIEYKRTFIFTALVRVDDEDAVRVDVEAAGEARRVLERLLESCIG